MISFGGGLGDDVLLTCVLREMANRGQKIGVITRYPDIFEGNGDVVSTLNFCSDLLYAAREGLTEVKLPWYTSPDPSDHRKDKDIKPVRHIIALMCSAVGIDGEVSLRPYWHFQPREREFGRFSKRQIAIQTTGLSKDAKMPLKEWFPERFQEVVDSLRNEITFVQIGRSADSGLNGVIDLRGKTTIRETASILSNSSCFVGLVGFLMHLARAVDCRSVIVYGGRESPDQTGYIANINLYSELSCAPCWGWHFCDSDRVCMRNITPNDVVTAVKKILSCNTSTLPVEKIKVVSDSNSEDLLTNLARLDWATNRKYEKFPPGTR